MTLRGSTRDIEDLGEETSAKLMKCTQLTANRRHFPEPFIWEVFYHMIEAASSMLNGPKQPNPSGHPRWDFEIVHRDIKPGNSQY